MLLASPEVDFKNSVLKSAGMVVENLFKAPIPDMLLLWLLVLIQLVFLATFKNY